VSHEHKLPAFCGTILLLLSLRLRLRLRLRLCRRLLSRIAPAKRIDLRSQLLQASKCHD